MNEEDDDPLVRDTLMMDGCDSDSESIDSDQLDPLGHSGVYTSEEVCLLLSEKMHRLQTLYVEQFKHLKFLLREKYRKYCVEALQDKNCVIADAPPTADLNKLRAMKKFHRYQGVEGLLKSQAKERRKKLSEGTSYQAPKHSICVYTAKEPGSVKCTNRSLPATNYCRIHILYDPHQVLFRPCANGTPSDACLNPVVSFQHKNSCILHRDLKSDQSQAKKMIGEEEEEVTAAQTEPEMFQSIDDMTSLALDTQEVPASLFAGLDPFADIPANQTHIL
jgi:KAT8 regulatory NSL complex subunit 2